MIKTHERDVYIWTLMSLVGLCCICMFNVQWCTLICLFMCYNKYISCLMWCLLSLWSKYWYIRCWRYVYQLNEMQVAVMWCISRRWSVICIGQTWVIVEIAGGINKHGACLTTRLMAGHSFSVSHQLAAVSDWQKVGQNNMIDGRTFILCLSPTSSAVWLAESRSKQDDWWQDIHSLSLTN